MSSSAPKAGERIESVDVTDAVVRLSLADGRAVEAPLDWFPRLASATPSQRASWIIVAGGFGVHWPEIDEDLSVEGLLRGAPSPESPNG